MSVPLHAAFEFQPVGAKAAGVGDTGTASATGAEGTFWNPAAVVWGPHLSLFGGYDQPFGLKTLQTQTVAFALKKGRHGLGLTYQGYGFSLYREQRFGITYGLRVSHTSLGLTIRNLHIAIPNKPNRQWAVFDLGFCTQLTPQTQLGAVARNVSGKHTATLGQGGALGLAITTSPGVQLLIDLQKEAGWPTGISGGLAYHLASLLTLRTGLGSHPERLTAGFSLHHNHMTLDYATGYHTVLGLSHRMGFGLAW